jgi:hypothetical protein
MTSLGFTLSHTLQQGLGCLQLMNKLEKSICNPCNGRSSTHVISIGSVENDIVLGRLFLQEVQVRQASLQALDIVSQLIEELDLFLRTAQSCDRVLLLLLQEL